jgi:hypothetical protein
MAVQRCTSSKVRPQPLQSASPWLVEQIAMQGVSGWVSYQRVDLGQRAQLGGQRDAVRRWLALPPVVDGGLDVGDVDSGHGGGGA